MGEIVFQQKLLNAHCQWEGGDDAGDSDGDGINDDDGDIDDDDGEDGAPVACGCVTTVTGGNRDGVTIRD